MRTATRHAGFLVALAVGTVAGAMTLALPLTDAARALTALDAFFATYLVAMIRKARSATAHDLRRHAADRDEGLPLILLLALTSVVASLTAILMVLRAPSGMAEAGLALTAAPLGWAVMHTLLAMHYAHAHYAHGTAALAFPGTAEPDFWDFLYFSFGIGMTAQVSDVTVQTPALRRWVLAHAVGSFFYNTVILALAVNAGLALAGQGA
jgi:uncharacterized membrane protein